MNEDIDHLSELAPPPVTPLHNGTTQAWVSVEQQLGFQMPSDYKQLVNVYGLGVFGEVPEIVVYSPFVEAQSLNIMKIGPSILDNERGHRERFPEYTAPFHLHPEPEGLFPWGHSDDGDYFFWLMRGESDEWPTVIWNLRGRVHCVMETSTIGVLIALMSGDHDCTKVFQEGIGEGFESFSPIE